MTISQTYPDPSWIMFNVLSKVHPLIFCLLKKVDHWVNQNIGGYVWTIYHTISMIVSGVYSGMVDNLLRYFSKVLDFVVVPKGVVIENIWVGYSGTGPNLTIPVSISSSANKYVVVGYYRLGAGTNYGATLNAASMTQLAWIASGDDTSLFLYGIIPASTGAQNVVISTQSGGVYGFAIECSGVNQTTPVLDTKTANNLAGTNTISTSSLTTSVYGLTIDIARFGSGTINPSAGQTAIQVNSVNRGSYLRPSGSSQVLSWGSTVSSFCGLVAASLNPVS